LTASGAYRTEGRNAPTPCIQALAIHCRSLLGHASMGDEVSICTRPISFSSRVSARFDRHQTLSIEICRWLLCIRAVLCCFRSHFLRSYVLFHSVYKPFGIRYTFFYQLFIRCIRYIIICEKTLILFFS
jgi:hypothetical protein